MILDFFKSKYGGDKQDRMEYSKAYIPMYLEFWNRKNTNRNTNKSTRILSI